MVLKPGMPTKIPVTVYGSSPDCKAVVYLDGCAGACPSSWHPLDGKKCECCMPDVEEAKAVRVTCKGVVETKTVKYAKSCKCQ